MQGNLDDYQRIRYSLNKFNLNYHSTVNPDKKLPEHNNWGDDMKDVTCKETTDFISIWHILEDLIIREENR